MAASASLHRARSRVKPCGPGELGTSSALTGPTYSGDGVEHGPLDLGAVERVVDEPAVAAPHVERVDDVLAERLHRRVADVEADLGEGAGDAVEHPDAVRGADFDDGRRVRLVVVERH